MVKRLLFPLLVLLLLSGCGSSAPPEKMDNAPMTVATDRFDNYGSTGKGDNPAQTEAPGSCAPSSTEAETGAATFNNHYFTLSRENRISTAEDGTELLYEYSCDVEFTDSDPQQDQLIDSVIELIRNEYNANSRNLLQYAQEQLEQEGKEYFYSYSNYQEIGVGRHDPKVVSLVVLSSIYSGGAHPNSVQTAWNLDMERGIVLKLEDVLCEGAAPVLSAMVQKLVDEKFESIGTEALFDNYQTTIQNAFLAEAMTPYWYLNDAGLVVFFNQYSLGPYAAGIIKLEIPYGSLKGILREDYFPAYSNVVPGNLLPRGEWEGYRQIPVTIDPDGQRILIGVEGQVFQVQISEIYWLEGTAIGQQMLFSADQLGQNDVLALVGGFDDPARSFAIEFQDGTGNTRIYYVHPDGLSEAP